MKTECQRKEKCTFYSTVTHKTVSPENDSCADKNIRSVSHSIDNISFGQKNMKFQMPLILFPFWRLLRHLLDFTSFHKVKEMMEDKEHFVLCNKKNKRDSQKREKSEVLSQVS